MLALTKKTDYALIALSCLARRAGGTTSARAIAEDCGVPLPILTNILKSLTHAEIVNSERGSSGGYVLARPPEAITLYELITATEGPIQFVQCILSGMDSPKGPCDLEPSCPIRSPVHRIHEHFKLFLKGVTLAELAGDEGKGAEPGSTSTEPAHMEREVLSGS